MGGRVVVILGGRPAFITPERLAELAEMSDVQLITLGYDPDSVSAAWAGADA